MNTGDRDHWLELNLRGMMGTFRAFVEAAGGEILELDGVLAGINPKRPERSVFNSVVYLDAERLAAERERIAAAFAERGCAWTVWVPEEDTATARMLERAGHHLDAEPRAMGFELGSVDQPDLSAIEWTAEGDLPAACLINDHAYGYEEGTWLDGTGDSPDGFTTYLASSGGRPAATVARRTVGTDCSIWSVATESEARGKGLATALMQQALWDAQRCGAETTTLQATKLGRPVYERVGYRDYGALQMWELRQD